MGSDTLSGEKGNLAEKDIQRKRGYRGKRGKRGRKWRKAGDMGEKVGIEWERVVLVGIRGKRYFKLLKHCLEIDQFNVTLLNACRRRVIY